MRTYAAEIATTNVRANLFGPGPTRTRMYASAFPGIDPLTLPTPEEVAKAILPFACRSVAETGKLYNFPRPQVSEVVSTLRPSRAFRAAQCLRFARPL